MVASRHQHHNLRRAVLSFLRAHQDTFASIMREQSGVSVPSAAASHGTWGAAGGALDLPEWQLDAWRCLDLLLTLYLFAVNHPDATQQKAATKTTRSSFSAAGMATLNVVDQ